MTGMMLTALVLGFACFSVMFHQRSPPNRNDQIASLRIFHSSKAGFAPEGQPSLPSRFLSLAVFLQYDPDSTSPFVSSL